MNDLKSNATINSDLWCNSEPNGVELEGCTLLYLPCFWDYACDKRACGICDMEKPPVFIMRGLCSASAFDRHYGWTQELSKDMKYSFRGFSKSSLFWNIKENFWQLKYDKNDSILSFKYNFEAVEFKIG